MKSKLSLVTCLFVVLGLGALSGCGDVDDEPANNSNAAATPAATQGANTAATPAASQPANTAAPAAPGGAAAASGTFRADPNPLPVCDGSGLGKVTLSWDVQGASLLYVRVGTPDGPLMAASKDLHGKAETGNWVGDNAKFFLVDASTSKTIATVVVKLTKEGCK